MSKVTELSVTEHLRGILLKDLRIQCRARGLNPGGGRETLYERLKEDMIATNDMTMYTVDESGEVTRADAKTTKEISEDFKTNNYVRPEGQNVGNFITERSSSRVLAPPGGRTSIFMGSIEPAAAPRRGPPSPTPAAPAPPPAPAAPAPAAYEPPAPAYQAPDPSLYAPPPERNYEAPDPSLYEPPPERNYDAPDPASYEAPPERSYDAPDPASYEAPPERSYEAPAAEEQAAPVQTSAIPQDIALGLSSGAEAVKNNYVRPEGQNAGNFITDRPSSKVLAPPGGKTSVNL